MSKRERLLIVLLLFLILAYAVIEFLPNHSFSMESSVTKQHKELHDVYDEMVHNIEMKDYYEENLQKLSDKIIKLNILTDIKQENILEVLYKHLSSSEVEITNINFTDVMGGEPDDLIDLNKSVDFASKEFSLDSESLPVLYMNVSVDFKSSFQNTLKLIDSLQGDRVNMAITNIHIIKSESNNVHGVMDISFYAVPMKN